MHGVLTCTLPLPLLLLLQDMAERVMDSNAQERERGITILAKNTAIRCVCVWGGGGAFRTPVVNRWQRMGRNPCVGCALKDQ
jgi:hypothetical protein